MNLLSFGLVKDVEMDLALLSVDGSDEKPVSRLQPDFLENPEDDLAQRNGNASPELIGGDQLKSVLFRSVHYLREGCGHGNTAERIL